MLATNATIPSEREEPFLLSSSAATRERRLEFPLSSATASNTDTGWVRASATSQRSHDPDPAFAHELAHLFRQAQDEVFEDGMSSNFARLFAAWVLEYRSDALRLMMRRTFMDRLPTEALSEALRTLARIDDFRTREDRFQILVTALWSESPQVRDAAGLGLAQLADPRGASHVKRAVETETDQELRSDLQQVADDLTIE